ncbi:MAG: class I SAM-dependent methyltransferase [Candidatus Magasanikbacteria bacterium]|nr:class I SAM-dependent methyltransferase [Candidatus Magasanikbacteria bacterium]
MRYYDPQHNRLIYIAEQASPEYWDRHWSFNKLRMEDLRREITRKHYDFLVLPVTRDYLSPGSRVLEGGCGTGVHVYNLQRHGFESIGIDNAPETVRLAKEAVPEMDIRLGDVVHLDFPDNHFDGYWSIGVIEHFRDGYDAVLKEMHRVLKPGGYLFLTFPYMSPLRRWRARRGQYLEMLKQVQHDSAPDGFYQFALDHRRVTKTFEANGFELIEEKPLDGWNGLAQEYPTNRLIIALTKRASKIAKLARLVIDYLARPVAGHGILLVVRKK